MILQVFLSLLWLASSQSPRVEAADSFPSVGDSLTVYVFLHDECVISQYFTPELIRLAETYSSQKVGFVGYFPNPSSTSERITAFGSTYGLTFPLKEDYAKTWTKKFNITITPEVAVWDHRIDQLIYRGRIDDSYVRVGKRKTHPAHHDLEETISNWLLNQPNQGLVQTQAIGCLINFTH